jgi:hypothetical protein
MIKLLWTLLLAEALLAVPLRAQDRTPAPVRGMSVGVEADLLPFLTGGFYGSLWSAHGSVRLRGVVSRVYVPEFAVPDGFRDQRVDAIAVIADYVPAREVQGIWVGAGLEYWNTEIGVEGSSEETTFGSLVATAGVGYIFPLGGGVYLNPWGAAHVLLSWGRDVQVGTTNFTPQPITGEVSLKLGYCF